MIGFKAFEKKFKKFESPAAAVKEGNAVDFEGTAGYCHVRDVSVVGRVCRLLSVIGYEGCYVIQDALSRRLQLELAHHCLSDCLQPKNKTNIHGHTEDSVLLTQLSDIWARESTEIDSLHGDPCPKLPKSFVLSTVRWVTLGYQYDWSARKYVAEHFVPFPEKLAALCSEVAGLVGDNYSLKPDAAIVNFYPEGAVMGGHVDDAELTYDHPVLSISIGCPCLFLLGGFDKESDPLPMILRSGDILIMGGKSRLRVHAVPKVFTKTLPPLYLHPSTVGRDIIHLEDCTHFLKGVILDSCSCGGDVAGNLLTSCETSDNTHATNSKRSTTVPLDVACKKQRHGQSADETAANNESSNENENGNNSLGICSTQFDVDSSRNSNSYSDDDSRKANSIEGGVDGEVDTKSKDTDAAKCCTGLTPVRETRVLKYLQTTRININVRQVYATQPKQEEGQQQGQDYNQVQGQEQEQEQEQEQAQEQVQIQEQKDEIFSEGT